MEKATIIWHSLCIIGDVCTDTDAGEVLILPSRKCCQYPVILDRKLLKVGAIILRDLTNVMVLLHRDSADVKL